MRQTVGGAQNDGDLVLDESIERGARLEPPGERDDGRAGVPGREHARPGVLGPAGRRDVEMRRRRASGRARTWSRDGRSGSSRGYARTSFGRAVVPEVK